MIGDSLVLVASATSVFVVDGDLCLWIHRVGESSSSTNSSWVKFCGSTRTIDSLGSSFFGVNDGGSKGEVVCGGGGDTTCTLFETATWRGSDKREMERGVEETGCLSEVGRRLDELCGGVTVSVGRERFFCRFPAFCLIDLRRLMQLLRAELI